MNSRVPCRHERGAVIVTVAMTLLFLLGFMGVALDFGRLFIVKTELQTAMDSCALAAAKELDGQADSLTRATSAGITAGNLNRVDLQSASWRGNGQITDADIIFRDSAYNPTTAAANARYVQCRHTQPGVQMWLLHAMRAFAGPSAPTPSTQNVLALAVARRAPGQSACPLPIALRPKGGGTAPDFGFVPGEWIKLITNQNAFAGGEIGWVNLDGSNSASGTIAQMNGYCGVTADQELGTPGVQTAVAEVWNSRFGIYKNNVTLSLADPNSLPDFTGYAYTIKNWPSGRNAYNGTPGTGAPASAENFRAKRLTYASCADTGTRVRGADSCESFTGLSLNSFQKLATPGATATDGHKVFGSNRRIVTVPVISTASKVQGFACMLMLQPFSIPQTNVQLEYIGNANEENSPCTSSGYAGGATGPQVPVLVQ
jgi:hypothetical protein